MGDLFKIISGEAKPSKEEMRAAAYAAIDKLVNELPNQLTESDLESISDAVGEAMGPVSAAVFKHGLLSRGSRELTVDTCACPGCGAKLSNPKTAKRKIETMHGPVEIERPHLYCRSCCAEFAPFDEKVGLASARLNGHLARGGRMRGEPMREMCRGPSRRDCWV